MGTHWHATLLIIFIMILICPFGWRRSKRNNVQANNKQQLLLAERLKSHVYKLSQEIGDRNAAKYQKLNLAAEYITQQLEKYGYQPIYQKYIVAGKEVVNIIAIKIGIKTPDNIILTGAHYDTRANPGADDNASGVAGLLELARLLSKIPTNNTIKFVAFVNEEQPFFKTKDMGSLVYAKEARKRGENLVAVIILEMIGYYRCTPFSQKYPPLFGFFYPNKGDYIAVIGDFHSKSLVNKVMTTFKNHSQFPIESVTTFGFIPGVNYSDHWSFWQEGYQAIMITDTSFYRNHNYHRQSDTFDTLNYRSMSQLVEGLLASIVDFGNTIGHIDSTKD